MRVEVDTQKVDETFESITKDFQRQAALPGFRPGKAPKDMVVRKYAKDIEDEVKKKLISDSYRKAIEEQKLDVLGYPDIEEIQFNRGQPLQFAATVETAPEFATETKTVNPELGSFLISLNERPNQPNSRTPCHSAGRIFYRRTLLTSA